MKIIVHISVNIKRNIGFFSQEFKGQAVADSSVMA